METPSVAVGVDVVAVDGRGVECCDEVDRFRPVITFPHVTAASATTTGSQRDRATPRCHGRTKDFVFEGINLTLLPPPPHHNRFTALFPGPTG